MTPVLATARLAFGWSTGLPRITRKTDKGLPRYEDAEESDVFILCGAVDLVPEVRSDASGKTVPAVDIRTAGGDQYRVHRDRPRIEGLFARIVPLMLRITFFVIL